MKNRWKYDEGGFLVNTALPDVFLSIKQRFVANHREILGRTI